MKKCLTGFLILGTAALLFTGCSDQKPSGDDYGSRQIGEPCDNEHKCLQGLFCEDGICRMLCNTKEECNAGEECQNHRCVKTGKDEPTKNKQKGESCDSQNLCVDPLVCEGGKCMVTCIYKSDCDANEDCKNKRCVAISGQITREVIMQDIISTADSATDNNGSTVQLKSNVISGKATDNNNHSIEINNGYWSR